MGKSNNMHGLIQIYTGDGKGKTTAAVGLAIRAAGSGLKVCYLYFHKDPARWGYGELKVLKKLGIDVFGFAQKHPHFYKNISKETVRSECLKALDFIKTKIFRKKYDLLILDEIIVACRDCFLTEKEIISLLEKKPKHLEIVLTGRGATKSLIKRVDLVTEMKKIKHPYDSGILSRKGIEF